MYISAVWISPKQPSLYIKLFSLLWGYTWRDKCNHLLFDKCSWWVRRSCDDKTSRCIVMYGGPGTMQDDMHMVSIRVRYGFRWHSDKPYRTSRRRVRYGLSECHLNPYRTRMDIICIFSHEITINLSFTAKKHIIEISQPPLQTTECDMASDQNCA